jgi:hypothetical protein
VLMRNPDPDTTFHFDADPDPDLDPHQPDYGSGSCSFLQLLSRYLNNISFFFSKFFAYYLLKVHLHQSSKIACH